MLVKPVRVGTDCTVYMYRRGVCRGDTFSGGEGVVSLVW